MEIIPRWQCFWNNENEALYEKYNGIWRKYAPQQTDIIIRDGNMIYREFVITEQPDRNNTYRTIVYTNFQEDGEFLGTLVLFKKMRS